MNIVWGETKEFFEVGQAHKNYKHDILLLIAIFKGENGERCHLVVVTAKSNSGL